MKKILFLTFLAASMVLGITNAQLPAVVMSDKAGWHKIGETTASFDADKDELLVLGADNFKSIKFKVTEAPLHIASLEIFYESGENESVPLKSEFKAGTESRVIDLMGKSRDLKKVVFMYSSKYNSNKDKAHIELYGLK